MADEDKHGFIVPNQVYFYERIKHDYMNFMVLFQPKNITYRGKILWFGTINDFLAFGIKTSIEMDIGTNGTFNKHCLFQCDDGYGVIVKDSVKLLRIDEIDHYVINIENNTKEVIKKTEFKFKDLVVIGIDNKLKVGSYFGALSINGIRCYEIKFMKNSNKCAYACNAILGLFTDKNGIVIANYQGTYNVTNEKNRIYNLDDNIKLPFGVDEILGKVTWTGTIDNYRCLGIYPENTKLISNYKRHFNVDNAFWTVFCLDILDKLHTNKIPPNFTEVENPEDINIFTYFQLNKYIKTLIEDTYVDGIVVNYVVDEEKKFFYGIKLVEFEDDLRFISLEDVTYYTHFYLDDSAFFPISDPMEYGIKTIFKIGDYVEVKPTKYNNLKDICFGKIVWMGFDKAYVLKFYLQLDKPNDAGDNGELYNQKIYEVPDKCGLLVLPSCLSKDTTKADNTFKIIKKYIMPRSKISTGENKGIQGDKNSCYLDTSFFAMFTFQELFDNLLLKTSDNRNSARSEIQEILGSHIIFPLRNDEYVTHAAVSVFRQKLGEIFPDKKFTHSEKDPEELMESLFHLLTPNDPLLNTFQIKTKSKQSCFLIQLFFMTKDLNKVSISEMISRTFLESDILIDKPPKCLILQLPRDGNQYKQYKEVQIYSDLDITHLIRYCYHKCKECSVRAMFFCKLCSEKVLEFTYYCLEHKSCCNHEKFDIRNEHSEMDNFKSEEKHFENTPYFNGKVVLKLFAILCIEKTHYVAYVKTGEVIRKWIYFDSMGKLDGHDLQPVIRETFIENYLLNGTTNNEIIDDVQRIKSYAFVCFYKNPAMEFYSRDFNHIDKK